MPFEYFNEVDKEDIEPHVYFPNDADNYTDYETIENQPYRQRPNIAPHLERNVCLCRTP